MRWWRPWVLGVLIAFSSVVEAAPPRVEDLPAALRDWVAWVRFEHPDSQCPLIAGAEGEDGEGARDCAWPGQLSITANDQGARFRQRWTLYARGAVMLPGSDTYWPQDTRANGQPLAVVADENGNPVAWLEPGSYDIEGALHWSRRPESIPVSDAVALVRLELDGANVFPLQRENGALWLGAAETTEKEADSLDLQVFRHLADAVPAVLTTRLIIDISGAGREEVLGKPLPADWQPTALSSDLPARLDPDGALRIQARPGHYEITLVARATKPLFKNERPKRQAPWPEQEIWSYQANPALRVTVAEGASAMDPAQAGVPEAWSALPAFLMEQDSSLDITERSRGLSEQDQNRLSLQRTLWLDFDGGGFTGRDQISGTMVRDWRLDMDPPFELMRAESAGEGLLVTTGAKSGSTGVELRERALSMTAGVQLRGDDHHLPVTGWMQNFESVNTTLQLPPGYKLYAAFGVDQAPQSWLARWDLLDVFLVAFVCLLAFWLLRWPLVALMSVYLVLGYHETGAPVIGVACILALTLFTKVVPAGTFAKVVAVTRWVVVLVVALYSLPFVYNQVRYGLHPQLERGSTYDYGIYAGAVPQEPQYQAMNENMAAPMPAAPVAEAAPEEQSQELDAITVTGSRVGGGAMSKSQNVVQALGRSVAKRYANNASIQAGGGEPTWSWSGYQLIWSGPVLADQTMRLVISPPWLTRLLRFLLVAVFFWMMMAVATTKFATKPLRRAAAIALLASAGTLGLPATSRAAEVPTPELLEQLGERLAQAPDCAPGCAHLARADVSAIKAEIRVVIEAHAATQVAVPLPNDERLVAVERLTVDGRGDVGVLRRDGGEAWIVLDRGVHRIELQLRAADADKIALAFPLRPAEVHVTGDGWEFNGLRQATLLTDTLELVRVREGTSAATATVAQQFPAFVVVHRYFDLDLDWSLRSVAMRLAPAEAGFSVNVPLVAGERVLSSELKVEGGRVVVPIQAGQASAEWLSQLPRTDTITLEAPTLNSHAEIWYVRASPTWNLQFAGVPVVQSGAVEEGYLHEFHPLPGEKLLLTVGRPDALPGNTVAIDGARLDTRMGQRATEYTLSLDLRATQGGQHVIRIPAEGEVLSVTLDGQALNVRPEGGKLSLPLHPGSQKATVQWRSAQEIPVFASTPEVALGAPASNLTLDVQLPENRWVLLTEGPRIGPAVLYWGELVVMILIALLLAKTKRTVLRFRDWLLLGLGFSTFNWYALALFVGWLFALDARARWAKTERHLAFVLGQIVLAGLTVFALGVLIVTIGEGLVGKPDMHVEGNNSYAYSLHWFQDKTNDLMPVATVTTLSIYWYKAAMLAWALWLATALTRWLRWGWDCYSTGGLWRALAKPKPAVATATTTAAATPAPTATPAPKAPDA